MSNLKKIFDITKKSISVMLSAVLCLNVYSSFVYAIEDSVDEDNFFCILGDDASGKETLANILDSAEIFLNGSCVHVNGLNFPTPVVKGLSDNLNDIDLILLTIPCKGPENNNIDYTGYLRKWFGELNSKKYTGTVKVILTKTDLFNNNQERVNANNTICAMLRHTEKSGCLQFKLETTVIETSAIDYSKSKISDDLDNYYYHKKKYTGIMGVYLYINNFQKIHLPTQRKKAKTYPEGAQMDQNYNIISSDEKRADTESDGKNATGVGSGLIVKSAKDMTNTNRADNLFAPKNATVPSGDSREGETPEFSELDETEPKKMPPGMVRRKNRDRKLTNKQIAGIGAGGAAIVGLGVAAAVLINKLTHNHK